MVYSGPCIQALFVKKKLLREQFFWVLMQVCTLGNFHIIRWIVLECVDRFYLNSCFNFKMWVCIWKCNLFVGGVVDKGGFFYKKN